MALINHTTVILKTSAPCLF